MSEAPDYARKLMGVRKWHVGPNGLLHSTGVNEDDLWEPGADRKATCLVMNRRRAADALKGDLHFPPNEDCSCGLHAFVNLDTCNEYFHAYLRAASGLDPYITGVVSARGEVIYAGYGFRAEYMSIEALIIGEECIGFLGEEISLMPAYRRLAKTYDVPLIYNPEVMSFMKDMGVVLDAYVPEEDPEEELKATPSTACIMPAGKPIQKGAQLAFDRLDGTVHHRRPGESPIGFAEVSAKAGKLVSIALRPGVSSPSGISFTPMKPTSPEPDRRIMWASISSALSGVGLLFCVLFAVAALGLAPIWIGMAFGCIVGSGFALVKAA